MANTYEHLKFKRGYIISSKDIPSPNPVWDKIVIDNLTIHVDPANQYEHYSSGQSWIFILGKVVDTENKTLNLPTILKRAFDLLQHNDETHFFDYIDTLAGRYLILFKKNNSTRILSDATGMRSILYSKTGNLIGSHIELLQSYLDHNLSSQVDRSWLGKYTNYQLPGNNTIYEDILYLTPNTLLELERNEIVRFFPREELSHKDPESAAIEISRLVKGQLELLSKEYDLLFSLTAGIDSRTSLALIREYIQSFLFFTYSKEENDTISSYSLKSLQTDVNVVKEMVKSLNLNHQFFTIPEIDRNDENFKALSSVLKTNNMTVHNHSLANIYLDRLSDKKHLHIRSNLLEIGRAFYKKGINRLPKDITPETMTLCYSAKAVDDEKVLKAFEQYYSTVDMDKIFNYDPYDIFYWEYRMGIWHSQLLLESDIAHDTYILFNSRNILNLLLGVKSIEKHDELVFKQIIKNEWPVLNYWKINSEETLEDYYDSQLDEYGIPLKDVRFTSGTARGDELPVSSQTYPNRFKFYINKSNPTLGDYMEASIPLSLKMNRKHLCILHIRSPYENKKYTKRLKYEVYLNDEKLLEEDISAWRETNQITLNVTPKTAKNSLKIRVVSTRNCEDWNWGRAATILVERIVVREVKEFPTPDRYITATSPFSILQVNNLVSK
ncbi:hypothetical protein QTG56_06960 [Rossellomorea sp. AcN35-11]|nr:hypothetical protein [Rossellomorea aquimaris]WJV30757.1 hypothetical protein QTG56_06960 [Rossellomorea sp. AcN35-11]